MLDAQVREAIALVDSLLQEVGNASGPWLGSPTGPHLSGPCCSQEGGACKHQVPLSEGSMPASVQPWASSISATALGGEAADAHIRVHSFSAQGGSMLDSRVLGVGQGHLMPKDSSCQQQGIAGAARPASSPFSLAQAASLPQQGSTAAVHAPGLHGGAASSADTTAVPAATMAARISSANSSNSPIKSFKLPEPIPGTHRAAYLPSFEQEEKLARALTNAHSKDSMALAKARQDSAAISGSFALDSSHGGLLGLGLARLGTKTGSGGLTAARALSKGPESLGTSATASTVDPARPLQDPASQIWAPSVLGSAGVTAPSGAPALSLGVGASAGAAGPAPAGLAPLPQMPRSLFHRESQESVAEASAGNSNYLMVTHGSLATANNMAAANLADGTKDLRHLMGDLLITDRNGSLLPVQPGPGLEPGLSSSSPQGEAGSKASPGAGPSLMAGLMARFSNSPQPVISPPGSSTTGGAGGMFSRLVSPVGSTSPGGGLLGQQGLKLWTGNKSKADVVRLGVRLIQAKGLGRGNNTSQVDPFATIKCEKTKRMSKAVAQSKEPHWDEFFVFDVLHPAFAVLRVKVYDDIRCWRPVLVGEFRVSVKSISDFPNRYSQPTWVPLRSRVSGMLRGQVQLQMYYMSERVHRPLHVMCCTWNVGNAPPSEDLAQWLKGVDKLEHDLVAIGVQECTYKTKGDKTTKGGTRGEGSTEGFYDDDDDDMEDMFGEEGSVVGTHLPGFSAAGSMRQRKNSKSFTVGHTGALEGEMSFGQLPNSPARRQQAGGSAKGRVATNSVPPGQAVGGEGSSAHGPSLHATSHASQGALSSLVPSNSSRSLSAGDLGAAGSQHPPERVSRNGMPVAGAAVSRFGVEAAGRAHGLGSAASVAGAGGVGSTGGAPPFSRPSLIQQPQHPGGMRGAHSLGDLAVHGSELSHTGPHGTNRGDAASLGATSVPPGQGRKGNTQFKRGIRLQEVDVGGKGFRDVWEERLREAMGPHYWMVRSAHMGQIRLLLFARNDIYAAISRVEKGTQATGVAGVATNKGGVAIAVQVWDTEICFVNSHLAAHQDKSKARNNNYRDIIKGIRMDPHQMDILTAYHHVFWMGDLNYRLDYGAQATNPTETPLRSDFDGLVTDIEAAKWQELLALDQLRKEMAAKRAFLGFSEADPLFMPTFKVDRRRGIRYKPQRSPAWCDRVLFRSNLPLKQVKPVEYFCAPDVSSSDHKPVSATFSVPTVWRQDDPSVSARVNLVLSYVSCTGLFMLRKRRASSTTSAMPSPQVILRGTCMSEEEHRTSVRRQTREPLWEEDISLPLKPGAIQDLAHRRLLVRVVDVGDGKVAVARTQNTLARGVLPLTQAATSLLQHSGHGPIKPVRVKVQLEYNGLPAGNMEVDMRIEVEQRRSHDRPSHTGARSLMSRFSMSARHQSGVHAHSPPPWEPFGGAYGAGGMFMD